MKAKLCLLFGILLTLIPTLATADSVYRPAYFNRITAAPQMATGLCSPTITGNYSGINGTTHDRAFDGSTATYFESSYDNWQFIEIDFNCVGQFNGVRRYMTRDGSNTTGNRALQGESIAYSLDGTTWTNLTGSTTSGWGGYNNYVAHAWNQVVYGWSDWLLLNVPEDTRFVRYSWDGAFDAFNEIALDFVEPTPQPLPRGGFGQQAWPMLHHDGARRGYTVVAGPDDPTVIPPWPFPTAATTQSAPIIGYDGVAYIGDDAGTLFALYPSAAATANLEKWRFESGDPIVGAAALKERHPEIGFVRVYFGTQAGEIFSLNSADGRLIWSDSLGTPIQSSPAVVTLSNDLVQLYILAEDGVYRIDEVGSAAAPTASIQWQFSLPSNANNRTSVALAPDASAVYATDGLDTLYFIDTATGTELCDSETLGSTLTTPVVDPNGFIYVASADGQLHSYAPLVTNGACQHRWTLDLNEPIVHPPALVTDGRIAVATDQSVIVADRINGTTGCADCWNMVAPAEIVTAPIADGRANLYFGGVNSSGQPKVYGVNSGSVMWEVALGTDSALSAPALDGRGRLYIAESARRLYVLADDPAFQIAFESDLSDSVNVDLHTLREIYGTTDPLRTIRLTDDAALDSEPTYSIDGRLMAFVSTRAGSDDIFFGDTYADAADNLTAADPNTPFTATSAENWPTFSPIRADGSSALRRGGHFLALTQHLDNRQIYLIDLVDYLQSGTISAERLTDWLADYGITTNLGDEHAQAAFSPDGSYLAYSACSFNAPGQVRELKLIDLVFGGISTVTSSTDSADCSSNFPEYAPAFSPDSRYLVYQREGKIEVAELQTVNRFNLPTNGMAASRPHWSPDGTEIVFTGSVFGSDDTLYVARGANYGQLSNISDPIDSKSRYDHAEYHPYKMPEPYLNADCKEGQPAVQLSPTAQQPGSSIEVRGCGFDIKFPARNQVYFRHVNDSFRWVRGEVTGAAVDAAGGLGVLQVTVPLLAGDGDVAVVTPYGRAETSGFRVIPLPLQLVQSASVVGAQIRVMGYGYQLVAANNPRLNRVYFSDGNGNQTIAATVTAATLGTCGTVETPCPANAPTDMGSRVVTWLEVTVPTGVANGAVEVRNAPPNSAETAQCRAPNGALCQFSLLQPSITPSRDNGSAGNSSAGIQPVSFDIAGAQFPYDTYFNYTTVDLHQIDNDPTAFPATTLATNVSLNSDGTFTSNPLDVAPNSGGEMTLTAHLSVVPTVEATAPFRTPIPDLPMIYVAGTSGNFITNFGSAFGHGTCLPSVLDFPFQNSYQAGENVWIGANALSHVVLLGCDGFLDATKLSPTSDAPSHPDFASINVGSVIDRVTVPIGSPIADDKLVYEQLLNFVTAPQPAGLGRFIGNANGTCIDNGGNAVGSENCFYPLMFDWRKGMNTQAAALATLVDNVRGNSTIPAPKNKVQILTHSYGGPTTQFYMRTDPTASDDVDQVFAMGGGFMGVMLPYKILQMGDNWGIEALGGLLGLDKYKTQELAEDWPTAYWQLPQQDWFEDNSPDPNARLCPPIAPFAPVSATNRRTCAFIHEVNRDFDGFNGIQGLIENSADSYRFMENTPAITGDTLGIPSSFDLNMNATKFNEAQALLLEQPPGNRALGDWRDGTDGVFFHRLVATGVPTIGRMQYEIWQLCAETTIPFTGITIRLCSPAIDQREPVYVPGDHTIPYRSLIGLIDEYDDRIWGINAEGKTDFDGDGEADDGEANAHLGMTRMPLVHQFIQFASAGELSSIDQVLQSGNWGFHVPQGVPTPSRTPEIAPDAATGWQEIKLDGMSALHIYDAQGRHTGPVVRANGTQVIERGVPGIIYNQSQGSTIAFLPSDSGSYQIEIAADGRGDVVNVQMREIAGMKVAGDTALFLGVPLTGTTKATLDLDTAGTVAERAIKVDYFGDGNVIDWSADALLDEIAAQDMHAPTTAINVEGGLLTINADDSGGAGLHQIFYGTDRGHVQGQLYSDPIELPDNTTYVWAFALDRAGNVQYPPTVYESCELKSDFDGNGVVESADIAQIAAHWPTNYPHFDLNGNNKIDLSDLLVTSMTLGDGCGDPQGRAVATISADKVTISAPSVATVGDVISADVIVDNAVDLAGFELAIAHNPAVLQLEAWTMGDLPTQTGRTPLLLNPTMGAAQHDGATVWQFGGLTYGNVPAVSGTGVLLTVTYRVIGAGSSPLALRAVQVGDATGGVTQPPTADAVVTTAVPTQVTLRTNQVASLLLRNLLLAVVLLLACSWVVVRRA